MTCRLGIASPQQVWTGTIEYREVSTTPASPFFEGCRVTLENKSVGTIVKLGSTATVQWDDSDASTEHALEELKLADETPNEIKRAKPITTLPERAKYGQRVVLGAVVTLPSFDDSNAMVAGYLDLCDFQSRISLQVEWQPEKRLMVLVETDLVCGRNCDWQVRFNQDSFLPGTRYELELNAEQDELRGEFALGTIVLQRKRLFALSQDMRAPGLCLEEEEHTLSLSGENSNSGVALANAGFARGVYYWEIRITCAEEHGTVFVGCAERPNNALILPAGTLMPGLSRWEKLPQSWGFINFRATQCGLNGGTEQIYGEFFESGNVVGVLLDMDQGEISFFIDAIKYGEHVMRDLGVAFTPQQLLSRNVAKFNPEGDSVQYLFPALGLKKNCDNSLELSDKFIAFPGTEPEEEIDNLAQVKLVLSRFTSIKPFPAQFQSYCWLHYERMMTNRFRRYPSRAGGRSVEVDISLEAMQRACEGHISPPLRVGEVVRTLQSDRRELATSENAVVLGARLNRVWYRIQTVSSHEGFGDGATWAFYWEPDEFGTLVRDQVEEERRTVAVTLPNKLDQNEFLSACLDNAAWSAEQDSYLMRMVNSTLQRAGELDAMNLDVHNVPLAGGMVDPAKALGRIAVLRLLNCMIRRALPLLSEDGLAKLVHQHRHLLFTTTKRAFFEAVLKSTTQPTTLPGEEYVDPPQIRLVQINRIKATPSKMAEIPQDGKRMKRSVFGQLYAETLRWPDYCFRRSYAGKGHGGQKRAFKVKLIGEGVDDYGGPYRQVFEAICDELQNDTEWEGNAKPQACLLPLLIPCPNRYHSVGDFGRDKFVLNCSANSPSLLRRFEFLGKLMGTALRHGLQLRFDFPELFWRQLVGLPVHVKHLEEIDLTFCRDLQLLERDPPTPANERKFQVTLSDGKTIVQHATWEFVDISNVKEYVDFAIETRLQESAVQFNALKRGLASVIPIEHFKLFTAEELETLVCGTRGLDIDLLRAVTEYENGLVGTEQHVLWFWEVLEESSLLQRELFLIFVWARSRMPSRADLPTRFRLQQPSGTAQERPDEFLPTAQTCFFSLSLPRYSGKEMLRRKLLFSIEHTSSMDADVRLRSAEGFDL